MHTLDLSFFSTFRRSIIRLYKKKKISSTKYPIIKKIYITGNLIFEGFIKKFDIHTIGLLIENIPTKKKKI